MHASILVHAWLVRLAELCLEETFCLEEGEGFVMLQ